MSGIVGYRKSEWDGATSAQRAFLRSILNALKLGSPALGTVGGEEWYVFADHRIDPQFVENLAWANSALPLITSQPVRDYEVVEGDDPLTVAADAQGSVAWFTARQGLPPGWVPDDGEV